MSKKLNGWYKATVEALLKWGKLIIFIVILVFGIGKAWGMFKSNLATAHEDIVELKIEGCTPAQTHIVDIAIIQTNMLQLNKNSEDLKQDFKAEREERKKDTEKILDAINKKQ